MFNQEFEWLTSNTRIAYPFVSPVDSPSGAGIPFSHLVVDAYVTYLTEDEQDVRLHTLGDPTGLAVAVEFRFTDNSVAFTSVGADFKKSTYTNWTLLEWTTDEGAARLLLDSAKIASFTWPAAPVDAYLVPHAVQPIASFVNTLTAEAQSYDGTVELVAGYNTEFSIQRAIVVEPSARQITYVQIDVDAGAGLGTYPDCEFDTPPIYTINGMSPDDQGNFQLVPKDCYKGEIPIVNPVSGPPWIPYENAYKLSSDCSPCCECDDYVYVYDELLRRVFERARTAAERFYTARDAYRTLYERMVVQKACREVPTLEINLIGRQGWCVVVQVVVRNNGGCTANNLAIEIEMGGPAGDTVPDAQRIDGDYIKHKPFVLQGAWPTYTIEFTDGILGARSLVAKFEIYFPLSAHVPGAAVTATATGTIDGQALEATAETTLTEVFNKY